MNVSLSRFLALPCLMLSAHDAGAQSSLLDRVDEAGIESRLGESVAANALFTDSAGTTASLETHVQERPFVLALVYFECPGICSVILTNLVRTLRTLPLLPGEDFDVVVVSIDPGESHLLARQRRVAAVDSYGAPATLDGWHFLTGEEEQIRSLADSVGYHYSYDPDTDQYVHGAALFVVRKDRVLSHVLQGAEVAARDLRLALVEASQGELGTWTDQVLLLCFQYDPSSGRFALVLGAVRFGALLTVVALVALILYLRRRERRAPESSREVPSR